MYRAGFCLHGSVTMALNLLMEAHALGAPVLSIRTAMDAIFLEHLEVAFDANCPSAASNLGVLYACGIIVEPDWEQAVAYLQKAQGYGHPLAETLLSCLSGIPSSLVAERFRDAMHCSST